MKNKKGFTLIELLGVIVVLAIIALIAVPILLGVIEKSKKGAFKDSVLNAFSSLDYLMIQENTNQIPEEGITIKQLREKGKLKGDLTGGKFVKENGKTVANFITNGKYCAFGEINDLKISKDCAKLDKTEPISSLEIIGTTDSSISVKATCFDEESGISKYEYSKDNGLTWISDKSNIYTFTDLTDDTYNIKVKCTNGADINTVSTETTIYTVSFDQSTVASKKIIKGSKVGDLPEPIKDDSKFDGWYIDEELVTKDTIINSNIELKSHWKKYPTVTLTTEANTVLGQNVTATLIVDENGNTPEKSYSVTDTMKSTTTLILKEIGTYRVTSSSSDGLASYSNDIVVNYDNTYTIDKYLVRKYLFNNGDVSANSGGWGVMWEASGGTPGQATNGGSVGSTLYLTGGSSYKKDLYAKNTIDLTGWKRIVVVCTYHNNIGAGWSAIHLYTPGGYYDKSQAMTVTNGVGFDKGTTSLDVTSYQRQVRLALLAARTEWNVSQVYLEK